MRAGFMALAAGKTVDFLGGFPFVPGCTHSKNNNGEREQESETPAAQGFPGFVPTVPAVPMYLESLCKNIAGEGGTGVIFGTNSDVDRNDTDPANDGGNSKILPTVKDHDPRITCRACLNLSYDICTVARPGGLVSANRGYRPDPEVLQNCMAFEALPP